MKKRFLTTLAVVCSAFCLSFTGVAAPIASIAVEAAVKDPDETNQPAIGWVYAKANGKLYKRLFNHSTGQWIGDWIYVRDLKPGELA